TTTTAPEDQWHVGQGRLLPTTSVDQFAATLARWFGVSDSELPLVAPNIGNFSVRNLGFV
ncbi:MAG: Tat pathway signal protein, partial [Proteobacteria bacterium]|nr:Tat pathway signal protein [Pseudomonadota bacterium]